MSGHSNVDAMFSSIEALREGVASLLREIDMLKAENEALKCHVVALQEEVARAKHYIEEFSSSSAAAAEIDRYGRMERILPHDTAIREAIIAQERRKKGGL